MENDDILQVMFFSDYLDFRGKKKAERIARRVVWFAKLLDVMAGNDNVWVEPDNRLVVPSALGKPKEDYSAVP